MTWSYTPSDLATSEKDQVRLLVGDTDINAQLLADEEINWAVSQERNNWAAAARCAEMIGFLFTRRVDMRLGRSMQTMYSKTALQYFNLAKWLRKKANGTVVPWIGGMSVSDKMAYETNTDLVQPAFARNMMSNPWAGGYTPDITPPIGGAPSVDEQEEF